MMSFIPRPCFISSAPYCSVNVTPVSGFLDAPSVTAVVTKTLPLVTMGDDQPRPGIGVDHSTFSVMDQRSASCGLDAIGFDARPRNCGQLSESAAKPVIANSSTARITFLYDEIGAGNVRGIPVCSRTSYL